MAIVAVKCAKCGVKLGAVSNLWIQIKDKHLALVSDTGHAPDLEISRSGPVRIGESGTVVGGCKLQDIACSSCSAQIGTQCLKSTSSRLLNVHYIFVSKLIAIKSTIDGRRRVEPKIQQSLSWKVSTTTVVTAEGSASPTRDQSPNPTSHHKPQRQSGVEPVADEQQDFELDPEVASAFRSVLSYVERELTQLHEELRAVRSATDAQQKKQAAAFQDELSKTRAELDQLKDGNLRMKEELEDAKRAAREAINTAKGLVSEISLLKDRRVVPGSTNSFGGRASLKRSSLLRDIDDDSASNPPKRVAMTPDVTSGSQESSPTASAIKRSGFLSRPARRSSGIFGEKSPRNEEPTGAKEN
ncbi:hypothetical protein B0J13DRAFT_76207 [Dactylonectria estremocensis]|uniref:Mis18 domain-containing protein n=1 Tax=Dactylonectria estremocensis TaxID=1079267 RepID=A0A9P9EGY0_9HYPO|nr:hypothetical protein B0J13DRAFT_76207 [Dactylonectria estremocensis]